METTMQTSAPTLANPWAPTLGEAIELIGSREHGTITAIADYLNDSPRYQVRYVNGQGCLTTDWWGVDALQSRAVAMTNATTSSEVADQVAPLIAPQIPALREGERYAGIALDTDGKPTHHIILLPQQPDDRLTWDEATAWADEVGGALPTRQEQSLLFANCKDAFKPTWHWSCEQYAGNASLAWGQLFDNGYQFNDAKGYKGRVRAVRRFLID
jgi:hypothetical protein